MCESTRIANETPTAVVTGKSCSAAVMWVAAAAASVLPGRSARNYSGARTHSRPGDP